MTKLNMRNDGERLAALETDMKNVNSQMNALGKSVEALHGKFDTLSQMITTNYVAKETFEEYKKNKWLERIITILVTGIIMGLIGVFLREKGI